MLRYVRHTVWDGRRSLWAMSGGVAANYGLPNSHWEREGLESWEQCYRMRLKRIVAPVQLMLALGLAEVVNRPASGVTT